jgi:phage shock protein PspC (stress-responsive transcriptional regulator)
MRSRKLYRSTSDVKVAGVAAGLADHFDTDPALVRVIFVVLGLCGGVGLLLYAALWIAVPKRQPDPPAIDGAVSDPELSRLS